MTSPITDNARDILARSLPLLQPGRDQIVERMELHLRGAGGGEQPAAWARAAATLLVQLLFDQARSLVESGELAAAEAIFDEHRALPIDGRHYSRFGDALVPILRDLLGAGVPREVAGTWCDIFWTAIGELKPLEESASA
jgi:hemoglobin-like flavoprotein